MMYHVVKLCVELKWKLLSHVWLFVTPWTIQSMEFSRPEYWSGYTFPSPGDLPNPGIKPRSPALQADSLPAEPQGKPKSTGVGSLSRLQRIFPTQGSNPGLLHCRRILYQLSRKGSPRVLEWVACPFSSGSSRPRDRTGASCITGGFLTKWAVRWVKGPFKLQDRPNGYGCGRVSKAYWYSFRFHTPVHL